MAEDRFGNTHAPGLPYAHGEHIRSSQDDHVKLRHAWRFIEERVKASGLDAVYNLSGLERRLEVAADDLALLDDELAPALIGDRLNALALDHLGGDAADHAVMVFNRQTAAVLTATLSLVRPGENGDRGFRHRQPCLRRPRRRPRPGQLHRCHRPRPVRTRIG